MIEIKPGSIGNIKDFNHWDSSPAHSVFWSQWKKWDSQLARCCLVLLHIPCYPQFLEPGYERVLKQIDIKWLMNSLWPKLNSKSNVKLIYFTFFAMKFAMVTAWIVSHDFIATLALSTHVYFICSITSYHGTPTNTARKTADSRLLYVLHVVYIVPRSFSNTFNIFLLSSACKYQVSILVVCIILECLIFKVISWVADFSFVFKRY